MCIKFVKSDRINPSKSTLIQMLHCSDELTNIQTIKEKNLINFVPISTLTNNWLYSQLNQTRMKRSQST